MNNTTEKFHKIISNTRPR